jgi:uncharacterized protein
MFMNGWSAICQAAATGNVEVVRELVSKDPALVHTFSHDGWTPLHLAAHFGHVEAAQALIESGADVQARARNGLGSTPLLWAVSGGCLDTVLLLLAHAADVNETSTAGSSPLHKAAVLGNVAIARALVSHGANVNARNSGGQTPLTHALFNRHQDVALLLQEHAGSE